MVDERADACGAYKLAVSIPSNLAIAAATGRDGRWALFAKAKAGTEFLALTQHKLHRFHPLPSEERRIAVLFNNNHVVGIISVELVHGFMI